MVLLGGFGVEGREKSREWGGGGGSVHMVVGLHGWRWIDLVHGIGMDIPGGSISFP